MRSIGPLAVRLDSRRASDAPRSCSAPQVRLRDAARDRLLGHGTLDASPQLPVGERSSSTLKSKEQDRWHALGAIFQLQEKRLVIPPNTHGAVRCSEIYAYTGWRIGH